MLDSAAGDGNTRPMATDEEIADAHKKLEDEYRSVMGSLGDLYVAVEALKSAGLQDDIVGLLAGVEDAAKKARTGGILGSGAKAHDKALNHYRDVTTPTT